MILKMSKLIRRGATIHAACRASNIDKSTHYDWLKKAKDTNNKMHIKYKASVEKALAEYEIELLESIKIHSAKSWQAGAWILERRFRSKFGREAEEQDGREEAEEQDIDDKFL